MTHPVAPKCIVLRSSLVPLVVATCLVAPLQAESVAELVARQDVDSLREAGEGVLPEMVALYRQSNEDGRANIAWLFYHLGWQSEAAKDVLMQDVRTEHQGLRIWSQYALGRVSNDDTVVDVLFENMRHGERWLFRDKAACGLAYDQIHLTEPQKIRLFQRLIDVLNDPDAGTRKLAIQILQVRTGQRKGYRPNASPEERRAQTEVWRAWLSEYRRQVEGTTGG